MSVSPAPPPWRPRRKRVGSGAAALLLGGGGRTGEGEEERVGRRCRGASGPRAAAMLLRWEQRGFKGAGGRVRRCWRNHCHHTVEGRGDGVCSHCVGASLAVARQAPSLSSSPAALRRFPASDQPTSCSRRSALPLTGRGAHGVRFARALGPRQCDAGKRGGAPPCFFLRCVRGACLVRVCRVSTGGG